MCLKKTYDFVVVKKTFTFSECSECEGTGTRKRTFRKMTFVEDCPKCKGVGRTRHEVSEEWPLSEALKELQSIT